MSCPYYLPRIAAMSSSDFDESQNWSLGKVHGDGTRSPIVSPGGYVTECAIEYSTSRAGGQVARRSCVKYPWAGWHCHGVTSAVYSEFLHTGDVQRSVHKLVLRSLAAWSRPSVVLVRRNHSEYRSPTTAASRPPARSLPLSHTAQRFYIIIINHRRRRRRRNRQAKFYHENVIHRYVLMIIFLPFKCYCVCFCAYYVFSSFLLCCNTSAFVICAIKNYLLTYLRGWFV